MYEKGIITESEKYKLIEILNKISEEKTQEIKRKKEEERNLLAENSKKRIQDAEATSGLGKTTAEIVANSEIHTAKNKVRQTWLKGECMSIHGEGEDAELCYIRGR